MSDAPVHPSSRAPIRVLLVEDHSAFRQALALTFTMESDIEVIGQARTIAEAHQVIQSDNPIDVAVLDLDLPDGHGADLIQVLHAVHPAAQALILTASGGRRVLARAVEAGAAGVLHKSVDLDAIVSAVRRLVDTGWLLSPGELSTLLREARAEQRQQWTRSGTLQRLTIREQDVLALLGEGLSDKEIGLRLAIGKDTVHTHMMNLLKKLGAESRLQALIIAVRHGLIAIEREG
jgi:DNA-binding NarL/FixJ family response regulator